MVQRKSNKKVWQALTKKYDEFRVQAGWFEQSKYSNGASIGGIAAVQNYGAKIPVTDKLRGWFGANYDVHFKQSTHYLIIPPTHFMENCQTKNKEKWKAAFIQAWGKVFAGDATAESALSVVGDLIAGDIGQAIADVSSPPLSPITVKMRLGGYAKNNKKIPEKSGIGKRLVDTGQMIDPVSHKVEKK